MAAPGIQDLRLAALVRRRFCTMVTQSYGGSRMGLHVWWPNPAGPPRCFHSEFGGQGHASWTRRKRRDWPVA